MAEKPLTGLPRVINFPSLQGIIKKNFCRFFPPYIAYDGNPSILKLSFPVLDFWSFIKTDYSCIIIAGTGNNSSYSGPGNCT